MESGASPNPHNGAEELSGYLTRREKRVAVGARVPGPVTRRETAVCHKRPVRWCERGAKVPLLDSSHLGKMPVIYGLCASTARDETERSLRSILHILIGGGGLGVLVAPVVGRDRSFRHGSSRVNRLSRHEWRYASDNPIRKIGKLRISVSMWLVSFLFLKRRVDDHRVTVETKLIKLLSFV